MMNKTTGIHHITAIVGHPQENVDFYAGVLGLRLVKQTINFDDPKTYHLYFGDGGGNPGTIITFFPWENARQGEIGAGQVGTTAYIVPTGSFPFWEKRLETFNIPVRKQVRFDETYLTFNDPHGLQIEFVERESGEQNDWTFGDVTPNVAIKGFAGATLLSAQPNKTAALLEDVMGLDRVGEDEQFIRLHSSAEIGNVIDVKTTPHARGQLGVGTVHHIAWRANDDQDQLDWKQHLEHHGFRVTDVRDRNYFNAIYFNEPGDILFEIATDPPGFAQDEAEQTMGKNLKLPIEYEQRRAQLEEDLTPFSVRSLDK